MAQHVYSAQMRSALCRFFEEKIYGTPDYVGGRNMLDIRVNNYNFNPVFLRTPSQAAEVCEIPSLIDRFLIRTEIICQLVREVVTPLSLIDSQTRRTADSIFKYFFSSNRNAYTNYVGLKKAITSKGRVYYGASGLILNSNFEPIIIGLNEYRHGSSGTTFERHVLKVSPEVFISEGLLEKAIINKLIPFYTRTSINGTVRIEIDDISKYIVKPVPPKAKVQETMKEIMRTYKDEILENLIS